jgi:hypothetical protein
MPLNTAGYISAADFHNLAFTETLSKGGGKYNIFANVISPLGKSTF